MPNYTSHSIQKEKVLLFLQQFKSKLNWKNANKILDIGCGPGDITANYLLSPAPEHAEMIAVDISPDMIKLANETFSDPRLRFEVGDISDPKFGENYNGYFDTVFSFYCLHFVQNQWQAMKNIHDVLKPGGETLFTIIVDGPIYTLDRIIAKREKWAPYMQHQEKVLSPYLNVENADDKMKNLLLEVGFVVEECFLFDMTHKIPSKEDFFRMNSPSAPWANLCDEVQLEIFQYLPLNARKNARLVCQKWNRLLNAKEFVDTEVLCVPSWYGFGTVAETAKRSRRTLKFVRRDFSIDSRSLWKAIGAQVQCLHFDWCIFDSEGLALVFAYCVQLSEFSARRCLFTTSPGWSFVVPRIAIPVSFGSHLVRENLKKLHFDSGTSPAPFRERDLFVIAAMFPKLEVLEMVVMLNYNDSEIHATIPRFDISLAKLTHIRTFDVELHIPHPSLVRYYHFIKFEKVSEFDWSRMSNLRMNLNNFLLRVEDLNQILSHKHWTSLVLFEINCHPNVNIAVTAQLLNKLPHLKKFKLCLTMRTEGDMDVRTIRILFPALVKSHLEHIYIEIPNNAIPANEHPSSIGSMSWDQAFVNHTVRRLSIITAGSYNSTFSSLFAKHFLGIRKLHAEPGDSDVIFKYQKNLESLILYNGDYKNIGNDTLEHSSLQSLKIFNSQPSNWSIFEKNLFPNLKNLLISSSKRNDEEKTQKFENSTLQDLKSLLSSLSANCPNVEVFEFCWRKHPQGLKGSELPGILEQCRGLRQLRYLSLKINYKECSMGRKDLKKALIANFQKCPTLRAVWLQFCCIDLLAYVHIKTKKYEFYSGLFSPIPKPYTHSYGFR